MNYNVFRFIQIAVCGSLALFGFYTIYLRFKHPDFSETRLLLCAAFNECQAEWQPQGEGE